MAPFTGRNTLLTPIKQLSGQCIFHAQDAANHIPDKSARHILAARSICKTPHIAHHSHSLTTEYLSSQAPSSLLSLWGVESVTRALRCNAENLYYRLSFHNIAHKSECYLCVFCAMICMKLGKSHDHRDVSGTNRIQSFSGLVPVVFRK